MSSWSQACWCGTTSSTLDFICILNALLICIHWKVSWLILPELPELPGLVETNSLSLPTNCGFANLVRIIYVNCLTATPSTSKSWKSLIVG